MEQPMPPAAPSRGSLSPHDTVRSLLAGAAFFLLLCGYTLLRPVRDDMAVRYGADKLHWLFTATFVCTLLLVPAFGWVVRRLPRAAVLPACYVFLALNLAGFAFLLDTEGSALAAAVFFVWLSVSNLFIVSVFWSNVSDAFSRDEAHRLYGRIAAGGTLGALAGPGITAVAARHFPTSALLGLSAALLIVATVAMVALRQVSTVREHAANKPVGGSVMAGIGLTLQSPPLRALALLVICLTTVSTVLYLGLVDAVGKTMPNPGERKSFFATVDLAVNLCALAVQVLGTRRVVQRWGLRTTLAIAPLMLLAGFAFLPLAGTALAFAAVQVLHRAGEFALNKPGREMIYTTVDPESRFKAKNFVDTAVYRANDAASAWLINAVRAAGGNAIWLVGVPAALLWLAIGLRLGRRHDQQHDERRLDHEPA
ncbi:MFS transporter [Oxalobacteraceae bacterium OM1]|nr:MFS transporter [Oxalobacteraceae bacterium OM1]